jgi:hypothetical protein
MEVDETLVDPEFITIPGLGSLTARLYQCIASVSNAKISRLNRLRTDLRVVMRSTFVGRRTGPLTKSCLSFARLIRSAETILTSLFSLFQSYALKSKMLVRTLLKVLDVARGEGDADLMDLGSGDGSARRVVLLFTLSDVTHLDVQRGSEGD